MRRTASFDAADFDRLVQARESGASAVIAGWHASLLLFLMLPRPRAGREYVLVAGDPAAASTARLVELCGMRTLPLAGGAGQRAVLASAARLLREPGTWLVVAVDGPFGPPHRVQPGACALAGQAGAPLVPLSVSADDCWTADTWDRRLYPKPGARVRCLAGDAIQPAGPSGRSARRSMVQALQRELDALDAAALRRSSESGRVRP